MDKIVHMSSVHSAFDTRIFHKECKSLRKAGYEVVLVVPHEKDEFVEGVRIKAVTKPRNIFQRLVFTIYNVYRVAVKENASIYHFHDPELLLVGVLMKLKGKKVIYDAHENFRLHILNKRWIPKMARPILSFLLGSVENFAVSCFDCVVAASDFVAQNFSPEKTTIIEYYPDKKEMVIKEETPYLKRENIAIWTGRSSRQRGAVEMVNAIELVPERLKAKLMIVGIISPPELIEVLRKYSGWRHVLYTGWIGFDQVRIELSKAKVGLCVVQPNPNNLEGHPRKLYEYMGAGLPVVASNFPKWKEMIDTLKCGLTVDPFDSEEISHAITWLFDNPEEAHRMGERGRQAVMTKYNWERESQKLTAMYSSLLRD